MSRTEQYEESEHPPTALGYREEQLAQENKEHINQLPQTHQNSPSIWSKPKQKPSQIPHSRRLQRKVQDNPEYYRIDLQLTTKLYEIYRRSKAGSSQAQGITFGQKQQANQTMNYHKILQMLKDAQVKLQINQKLTILRAIKKFSFNHNFISKEQFAKVFKVIVHGLNVKEGVFKGIVKERYADVMEKDSQLMPKRPALRLNKNMPTNKLKTESTAEALKQYSRIIDNGSIKSVNHTIHTIQDKSFIKRKGKPGNLSILEQSQISTARNPRRRITTDVSRYIGKDIKERSYLKNAIEKSKVNKVSWDMLFKMTEIGGQSGISIPSFLSVDYKLDDIYV